MNKHRPALTKRDEAGFALTAVVIMLGILMLIALTAFAETGQSRTGTSQSSASSGADAAANAGMATVLYNIESGNFCTFPSPLAGIGIGNAPGESYTVNTADYWTSYPPPSNLAGPTTCAGTTLSIVPQSAVLKVTGTAKVGGLTTTETIADTLFISQVPQDFAAIQSGNGALSLANVVVQQPSSASGLGEISVNGSLTNITGGGCPLGGGILVQANVVANGSWIDSDGCTIKGSISLNGGSLSLGNNAVVSGDVTVDGNNTCTTSSSAGCLYVMQGATVDGSVQASGNIYLCPGNTNASWGCTNTSGKATVVGGAEANGSIEFGNTPEGTTTPTPPCNSATTGDSGNDVVGPPGCVYASYPQQVEASGTATFPSLSDPTTANNAWQNWSNEAVSCSDGSSTNTPNNNNNLITDISNATGPVVIALTTTGNCAGGYTLTKNVQLPNNANVALWAPCGLTIANGAQFQLAGGATTAQLSLIAPSTPPSNCGPSPSMIGNIKTVNNSPFQNGVSALVAAVNNFTISGGVNMTGEVIAGLISTGSNKLTITYSGYTPPGMVFGYQVIVRQRYISKI